MTRFIDARRRLPRWVRLVLGAVCVAAGVVLAARPFTSLSVVVVVVGGAAVATGVTRWSTARRTAGRLDDLAAAGWIVLGVVVVAWPDLSVRGIAVAVGVGMLVGGVSDIVGGLRGSVDEQIASVLKGLASVVFGVLALAWPEVTLLVVAVVFGLRTVLFGLSELLVAVRGEPGVDGDVEPTRLGFVRRSVQIVSAAAALVVALALGGVSAWLHGEGPRLDAFYAAPNDVPSEPGSLLRSAAFERGIPDGAVAWRILYTTTRADGVAAVASGIVVAPSGSSPEPRPVIAWAHGTTGIDETCAPSVLPDALESGALYALALALDQGWVIVATDYIGLGTDGPHPYLIGDPAGRSVLDAVRAATQLDELTLGDQTVVWGHSQGGGAALWTGQIAPHYAPDVDVVGVAALAPAADLPGLVDNLYDTVGGSLFAGYVVTGYSATYDDVDFDDYVRPTARSTVRELAGRCLGEPELLVSVLSSIATGMSAFDGELTGGALAERLTENVPRGPFEMPVLIGQGEADLLILPDAQERFARRLCDAGNQVDYRTHPGRDHVGLVQTGSPLLPELVSWTRQRLAGEPTPSTCP